MSLENRPVTRLIVAAALAVLTAASAQADDRTVTGAVTGAFETVVIEASKGVTTATAAAKEALNGTQKKKRSKKAEKTPAKSDAAKPDAKEDSADDAGHTGNDTAGGSETKAPESTAAEKSGSEKNDADKKSADDGKADEKPGNTAGKQPEQWPAVEVELAKARCVQLLKGVDAVTIPEPAFRKGDCGAMAPVRLISIGKAPEVTFSPPPVISCDLVVGLSKWLKEDVQPAAKKQLGSEVIRIESMSDYSCRMAYGRVGNKLSEHGKANALDIRGFITRKGTQAVVLTDWGQTKRDVVKQIAMAKSAAAKAEAARQAAEQANAERAEVAANAAQSATTGTKLPRKTLVEGLPTDGSDLAVPASMTKKAEINIKGGPTRLGGPDDDDAKAEKRSAKGSKKQKDKGDTVAALPPADGDNDAEAPAPKTATSRFLHEVHAAGCQIFGTTLGPEANEAHRNHFHVDMAERKVKKICD